MGARHRPPAAGLLPCLICTVGTRTTLASAVALLPTDVGLLLDSPALPWAMRRWGARRVGAVGAGIVAASLLVLAGAPLRRYEGILRPYVERAQRLIPGAPGSATRRAGASGTC